MGHEPEYAAHAVNTELSIVGGVIAATPCPMDFLGGGGTSDTMLMISL